MNVVQQETLKQMARYLQEQLQPQAQITPLQVQCAVKDTVLVLVQHPPGNMPKSQELFEALETAIATMPNALIESLPTLNGSQIKLFLRVLGQQKPYAFHQVAAPVVNPFELSSLPEVEDNSPQTEIQFVTPPISTEPQAATHTNLDEPDHDLAGELVHTPATTAANESHLSAYTPQLKSVSPPARRSRLKPFLIAGSGMAAALLLGLGGYALTRPCAISSCSALENAQTLTQQATQTLKTGQPEDAVPQAMQQLVTARRLVVEIPSWSPQHGQAQMFQQQLDQVLAAETKAQAASQKGQGAAQSTPDWQATQGEWRGAIAQLEAVPPTSPLHGFAQERLTAYRANVAFAGQRIATEQDAKRRLETAKKTSELAIARQNVAQKLPEWQQAQATWQVAVNSLQQVPTGTTAHAEAQSLLQNYQASLTKTRDRVTQEQVASNILSQAQKFEQQAKRSQQISQWSQAAASWQQALNATKQIPPNISVSATAQTLAASYSSSLQQAQTVMKIRGDLERVCLASERICNYTITNEVIQIKFVPTYERKVRTLGGMSQYAGDTDTLNKLNVHLASLVNALQTVSNNVGMPIQVYNSDNQLLASILPGQTR